MDTWDAIRARRNVREYADRSIADDDLRLVLEAGRRAPSSKNWQPWDFVVVTDREQLRTLSRVWQYAAYVAGAAATIAVVSPVQESEMQRDWLQFDDGQAVMSMMIAAAHLGIGSGHTAVRDQALAREVLGFPEDRFCVCLVPLGYPRHRPLRPMARHNRRPFDEVVHFGRW